MSRLVWKESIESRAWPLQIAGTRVTVDDCNRMIAWLFGNITEISQPKFGCGQDRLVRSDYLGKELAMRFRMRARFAAIGKLLTDVRFGPPSVVNSGSMLDGII